MRRDSAVAAAALRRAFDESFSKAPTSQRQAKEDLLLTRASGVDLAVRISEVAAVLPCPRLLELPSSNPDFRGLASVRGSVVAVYGVVPSVESSQPAVGAGWLLVCAADRTAAFYFDQVIGFEQVSPDAIFHGTGGLDQGSSVQVIKVEGANVTVISIADLFERVQRGVTTGTRE